MIEPALISDVAKRVHFDSIVINGLDGTNAEEFTPRYLEKLRAGGVTAVNVTTVRQVRPNGVEHGVRGIMEYKTDLRSNLPDQHLIVKSSEDIVQAKRNGKLAVILGFQNMMPIEDDVDLLEAFYDMGLRIAQLTHHRQNLVGGGCSESTDSGLTLFGREVVKAINALGLVLDVSHAGEKTAREALELSDSPPIFSHAPARGIINHIRGVSDELLSLLAEKDGVIGLQAASNYLRRDAVQNGATMEDYLNQVDYVVERIGVRHVGIGLDKGEGRTQEYLNKLRRKFPEFKAETPPMDLRYVKELNSAEGIPLITQGLLDRGYDPEDIQAILGGNFLRLFQSVWDKGQA